MLLRFSLVTLAAASTLSAQTTTQTIAFSHPQRGNPDVLIRAVQTLTSCPGVGETRFNPFVFPPAPPLLIAYTPVPAANVPAVVLVSAPTAARIPLTDFGISAGPGCDLGVDPNSLISISGDIAIGSLNYSLPVIRGIRVDFPLGLTIQVQAAFMVNGSFSSTSPVQLTRTQ